MEKTIQVKQKALTRLTVALVETLGDTFAELLNPSKQVCNSAKYPSSQPTSPELRNGGYVKNTDLNLPRT